MTDENRIAYLEAQIETTALGRDNAREMLAEMGKENARLRANVAVLTQALEDHRRELKRLAKVEAISRKYGNPDPLCTCVWNGTDAGAAPCPHRQLYAALGEVTP